MKRIALLALFSVAACATPAAVEPQADQRLQDTPTAAFNPVEVHADLQASARQRFGDAVYAAAIAAPSYIIAKHYMGLPPPPIVQPDGSYKYPEPPVAVLMRQGTQWMVATNQGFRPAKPEKAAAIDALLAEPAFWAEPDWVQPQCTDAGASLLMLKVPGRDRIIRSGACGATRRSERLVFAALES